MLRHGITFDIHLDQYFLDPNPVNWIHYSTLSIFHEQLALTSSLGFVPHSINTVEDKYAVNRIVRCAICFGSVPDLIFSIEVLGFDMKSLEQHTKEVYFKELTKLDVARDVGTAAILHEYGLTMILLEGRIGFLNSFACFSTDLSHWCLFNNTIHVRNTTSETDENWASCNLKHGRWAWFWLKYQDQTFLKIHPLDYDRDTWKFGPTAIEAAHLLLHGASWSQLLGYVDIDFQHDPTGAVKITRKIYEFTALDVAQGWSDAPPARLLRSVGSDSSEDAYVNATDFHITWSNDGTITRTTRGIWGHGPRPYTGVPDCPDSCPVCNEDQEVASEALSEASILPGDNQGNHAHQNPVPNDALFTNIISTPQGRRQMQRFPLVKVLTCALQLAGYRAEMDDEGDIWFDDDDGDPYSDAVEHTEDLDRTGPLGGTCPICRDPEAYGLGHVLDRAEAGLAEWRRERQKFVDRGALPDEEYAWPSWTRRGGRR